MHILLILICGLNLFNIGQADGAEERAKVILGVDRLFTGPSVVQLKGKRIALVANQTSVNEALLPTAELLKAHASLYGYALKALFAPEHGLTGSAHALEQINQTATSDGIPIYGLFGRHQRPTAAMLANIDLIIYDIQDIGSRSYTYITTLFYVMEEAAKHRIPVMVLDRPNPINGQVIDGPMLEEGMRSIVGYINVPYCHGMTVGELANFFNLEYQINCDLIVVPMEGWQRSMTFADTGFAWIATSPQVPESTTPLYYPVTGILGELSLVSIGVGYTLPFKVVGAPWIDADSFAKALNAQNFLGVHFQPFHFKPFFGKFAHEECHGALVVITDPLRYAPVSTQYLIIGLLKGLYPQQFQKALKENSARESIFTKVNGSAEIYRLIAEEKNIVWKLRGFDQRKRERFASQRRKYLLY